MEKNQYVRITNPAPLEGDVCFTEHQKRLLVSSSVAT